MIWKFPKSSSQAHVQQDTPSSQFVQYTVLKLRNQLQLVTQAKHHFSSCLMVSSIVKTCSWIHLQQTDSRQLLLWQQYCLKSLRLKMDFLKTSPVKWDNTHLYVKSIYELIFMNLSKNLSLKLNLELASEKQQRNTLKNYMLKPATSYYMDSSPLSYLTLFFM